MPKTIQKFSLKSVHNFFESSCLHAHTSHIHAVTNDRTTSLAEVNYYLRQGEGGYIFTLPISYLIGERQLLFYWRLLCSDNIVLRTLAGLVRFEMLGIAAKYDIKSIYFSSATVKNAVCSSFVNVVKF